MKSCSIYICLFQFFLIGILLPACNLNDQTGKASSPPVNTPNRKTVPVVIPVTHSTPVKTKIARDKAEQKKRNGPPGYLHIPIPTGFLKTMVAKKKRRLMVRIGQQNRISS